MDGLAWVGGGWVLTPRPGSAASAVHPATLEACQ